MSDFLDYEAINYFDDGHSMPTVGDAWPDSLDPDRHVPLEERGPLPGQVRCPVCRSFTTADTRCEWCSAGLTVAVPVVYEDGSVAGFASCGRCGWYAGSRTLVDAETARAGHVCDFRRTA